jgi:anti-sigma factor RsiW
MTGNAYNPDDPAFLISRALDDDLPEAERRRLDEALAQSESLRSEVSKFEAVDRLVQRWGRRSVELDWRSHAALTQASAAEGTGETGSRKIDELLRRWGGRSDEVEAVDLTEGVQEEIRGERRRATPQRYLLRIGLPLAAAAAIILKVTTTTWFAPPPQPICRVAIGPSSRTMTRVAPETGSTDVVSFARPTEALAASPGVPSIGFATIGVEPIGAGSEESAPL